MKRIVLIAFISPLLLIVIIKIIGLLSFPIANLKDDSPINYFLEPQQRSTQATCFQVSLASTTLKIKPLADFKISAMVVSTKRYHEGFDAKVVPLDIGVCWGEVAKQENIHKIKFEQYLRWLRYKITEPLSFDMNYLNKHAGNIHIVPANNRLKRVLNGIKKHQAVELEGFLVEIKSDDSLSNYYRKSSLTREDTGDGACELMWVKKVKIANKVYF